MANGARKIVLLAKRGEAMWDLQFSALAPLGCSAFRISLGHTQVRNTRPIYSQSTMDRIQKGWYSEINSFWPGT